jgi:CheY-like chemotaxis protein
MNAVELSEYEKELTQHKLIKINLEYILNLYFEKFLCLFKYKEIECETNFEKLKNLYVVTDEFNFIYYIRQIYTYLYYIVPKKEGFIFDYVEEPNDMIKIIIKKKNAANAKDTSFEENTKISKNIDNVNQVIQTKEMTKEVLYSMTKRLKFTLDINDNDCIDKNNNSYYLCLTIPIQKKNKSEEEDEFKDEDINEMIQNDANILEDKLKRQFPNNSNEQKSYIDTSTNNICDILNKSGEERERKDSSDSFLSIHKKETNTNKKTSNNNIKSLKKKISDNNIHIESQKKIVLLNNNDNNFLNKCLKISENKNYDKDCKEKSKVRHKSQQYLKIPNVKQDIKHRSVKNVLYNNISKNTGNNSQNLKFSGVFTKINKFGCSEELDYNDMSISNNIKEIRNKNNNKEEIIVSNNNHDILLKNKNLNSQINLELCSGNQNSTNFLSSIHGIKNSKLKSGYFISDIIGGENHSKNINININNHNIINIINDKKISELSLKDLKEKNISSFNENKEGGRGDKNKNLSQKNNNKFIFLPDVQNKRQKRFSHNMSPKIRNKDCMTFFNEEKKDNISKGKKTIYNDNINENDQLFLEANDERKKYLKKTKKNVISECIPDSQFEEDDEEEEEEEDDNEEVEDNIEKEEEKPKCNCLDILIVDDEKFNVMATQRMLKNLGYESDAAYDGEECINLIKEKQKLNCGCNKNYYKLILLDIVMPVLDGIKTAKKVQEMIDNKEINENIKIIFVSGNIDGENLKNSLLQMDCVKECLQKPVRIDKYQKMIEKYYK